MDTNAWMNSGNAGPGKPEGGEAVALRAFWKLLQNRYGAVAPPAQKL